MFKPIVTHQTYVSEIKGDYLMKNMVKDSLDYFNQLGDNGVIDYEPKYGKLSRPVIITVKVFSGFWEEDLAGYTYAGFDECTIYVNQNESDALEFRKTVIHEYLHCLGYKHIDDKEDVMYYSATPGINTDISIKKYAEEIKRRKE